MMKDIFTIDVTNEVLERIEKLNHESQPEWGKMNVAQMLAHCNVTYDMVFTDHYVKAKAFKKFLLSSLVKNAVVNDKPYKKNIRTAPQFLIVDEREFETEKTKLVAHIKKVQDLGPDHFEGKESNSFGNLTARQWNNMFYKHIDHHLSQFGV
jgi:Protein of unknown function (DUF1569)